MKITRYPQSCLLVEENQTRILIDPGNHFAEKYSLADMGRLDAVIFTHEHPDHFDLGIYEEAQNSGIPAISNQSVALVASSVIIKNDGETFDVGTIQISVHDLPHCLMVDGSEGPQNTGFLFSGRLFHPGDGIDLPGISADVLALPIAGPDISLKDAFHFAGQMSAKHVIPIHYDLIGTKPDVFASFAGRFNPGFTVNVLGVAQSIEL